MSEQHTQVPESPAPAMIELTVDGRPHTISYEQAFALGCSLLERKQGVQAAKVFRHLTMFTDRGPRAFIMWAFCEASAKHFAECSASLARAFHGEGREVAEALHNAFVYYHVGLSQEAIAAMTELANSHRELPTVCLLLGDMLARVDKNSLARKCWSLAIRRDRPGGAVAAVAQQRLARAIAK